MSSPSMSPFPSKDFATEPLLYSQYSVDDIAKGITFVMFRVFKSLGPSELHDGSWQVCHEWVLCIFEYYKLCVIVFGGLFLSFLNFHFSSFFSKGAKRSVTAPHLHALSLLFNRIAFLCVIEVTYLNSFLTSFLEILILISIATDFIFANKRNTRRSFVENDWVGENFEENEEFRRNGSSDECVWKCDNSATEAIVVEFEEESMNLSFSLLFSHFSTIFLFRILKILKSFRSFWILKRITKNTIT